MGSLNKILCGLFHKQQYCHGVQLSKIYSLLTLNRLVDHGMKLAYQWDAKVQPHLDSTQHFTSVVKVSREANSRCLEITGVRNEEQTHINSLGKQREDWCNTKYTGTRDTWGQSSTGFASLLINICHCTTSNHRKVVEVMSHLAAAATENQQYNPRVHCKATKSVTISTGWSWEHQ